MISPSDHPSSDAIAIKTLLLTDLVDSMGLFRTLGDSRASDISARHDQRARELMAKLGAREIDKSDGFLLLFERPVEAVRYALEYQRLLRQLGEELDVELVARCGIHLGEVYLRQNSPEDVGRGAKPLEVEGLAKPTTARVMALAQGGQTLLTQSVFELARRAAPEVLDTRSLRWLAHGSYHFQGAEEPLEIFEVGIEGLAPLTAPPDSQKAERVVDPEDVLTLGWRPVSKQVVPRRPGWVLEEKLGEGGFGEVWRAVHQKSHESRVFKFCFSAEHLRSLQREVTLFRLLRETLGHRDDIARLLDWNFEEAPYSLELDYTEGGNIAEWAEEQGGLAAVPLATRLELVAQAAEALAAAHSVGVLHKDVKPANILITRDGEGRPKAVLTDFGVGTVMNEAYLAERGITQMGLGGVTAEIHSTSGGTHLYMAPELLTGATPTVQADLYALGIFLYQMVIGELDRPLAPGWERDIDDEMLREDLAALVDGSPERRPESAGEVARRLHYLDERRAARAREHRIREEAERSRRRRQVLRTVAGVATVFLVVVSILAFQAIEARRDAEKGWAQADQLIDFMLLDLHQSLEPMGRLGLLDEIAQSSQNYFESRSTDHETVDSVTKRGTTFLNIGDIWADKGDIEKANEAYEKARDLFEEHLEASPASLPWRLGLARALTEIGDVHRMQNEPAAAAGLFERALALAEELVAEAPENPEPRYQVGLNHKKICLIRATEGAYPQAVEACRKALTIARELTGDEIETAPWKTANLFIDTQKDLATVLFEHEGKDSRQAEELLSAALRQARRLAEEDPVNLYWSLAIATASSQGGTQAFREKDFDTALALYRNATAAYAELIKKDPTRVTWKAGLAQDRYFIAKILQARGKNREALELFLSAIRDFLELKEQDPTRTLWQYWLITCHEDLAELYQEGGDLAAALTSYRAARRYLEELPGLDSNVFSSARLARAQWHIGNMLARMKQREAAREAWRQGLEAVAWVPGGAENSRGSLRVRARLLQALGEAPSDGDDENNGQDGDGP